MEDARKQINIPIFIFLAIIYINIRILAWNFNILTREL
jgi:hypothetical protein